MEREDATVLMIAAAHGDQIATGRMLRLVHDQLPWTALQRISGEDGDDTLSATALRASLGPEESDASDTGVVAPFMVRHAWRPRRPGGKRSVNSMLRFFTLGLIAVCCLPACRATDHHPPGAAPKAESRVGLRVEWTTDHARRFADGAFSPSRPIMVLVWYPVLRMVSDAAKPLSTDAILDLVESTAPPHLKPFATESRRYTLDSIDTYATNPGGAADPDETARLWSILLNTPTRSVAHAEPASGRYPVVVYHPGLGGNPLENARLCEMLAARGYVVLTSGFYHQEPWQDTFFCGDVDTSLADIAFLVNHAATLPFADPTRLAVVGHSFGAQVALIAACEPGNSIDAAIALDTTLDAKAPEQIGSPMYRGTSWHRVLTALTDGALNCTAAVLNVSGTTPNGSTPDYRTVRRLYNSRLALATVAYEMDHGSYLSQAHWPLRPAPVNEGPGSERDMATYRAIEQLIADFLDRELRQGPSLHDAYGRDLTVLEVPPLERPTPNEALEIYLDGGIEPVMERYRALQSVSPRAKFGTSPILDQMRDQGSHAELVRFLEFLLSFDSNRSDWRLAERLGDAHASMQQPCRAAEFYHRALAGCDDPFAASAIRNRLEEIGDTPRAPADPGSGQ